MPSYRPQAKTRCGAVASSRGHRLGERLPGRRRHHKRRCSTGVPVGRPGRRRVQGAAPDVRLHHHAGAAAVRGVVDGAVHVGGPVRAGRGRAISMVPASIALPSNDSRSGREVLAEDRHHVDPHDERQARSSGPAGSGSSNMPSGGSMISRPPAQVDLGDDGRDERHQHLDSGRRCGRTSTGDAGGCRTSATSPSRVPVGRDRGQADQLVVVELVVLRRRQRRRRRPGAACRGATRRQCGRRCPRSAGAVTVPLRPAPVDGQRAAAPPGRWPAPTPGRTAGSGSSVRTSTVTSPRTPCGRPIRPTTTSTRRTARAQRSVSMTSTLMPRPPTADITVRSAVAVRPPRPMTLPRSSGCTRICRVRPRRPVVRSTWTSSS